MNDSSWDFDNNVEDILRSVNALVEDAAPLMDSNDPGSMNNHTFGSKASPSANYGSPGERTRPCVINVATSKARQDDIHRHYLDKRSSAIKYSIPKDKICQFCRNNGEPHHVYTSHPMKDKHGRVVCLRLRSFKCPICGATGDDAHTKKYCSHKPLKS